MLIRYFASLREQLGIESEQLQTSAHTVTDLVQELAQRGTLWQQLLADNPRLQVAVNQQMANGHTQLFAQDEIAFFPPVTGG